MRAYFFGNMYLSSIQQGIQSAHVVAEMFAKYGETDNVQHDMLFEWAKSHKTAVVLNAGYSEELFSLIEFFSSDDNHFPWSCFYEGQDALCGALTNVGIVLPEEIYETSRQMRTPENKYLVTSGQIEFYPGLSPWAIELADRLNKYSLAR